MPTIPLGELASRIGAALHGEPDRVVTSVATLKNAHDGDLSFLANPRYAQYLPSTRATAVILGEDSLAECPAPALVCENPYLAYARAADFFIEAPVIEPGIHASACVENDAVIHESVSIGPHCIIENQVSIGANTVLGAGCFVGRQTSIGEDCRLHAKVTVCHDVSIGARVVLHPGVVAGSDGFGIARDGERWCKVPQLGGVCIGDDVEIGANTTIDRGALENTVIGDGVKIDNQVQVGHNVRIGNHTAIAGCVGISGSARIGRHCMIAGGVGIVGHLEITDNVTITGMSMVTRSIREAGVYSSGIPVRRNEEWNRHLAQLKKIESLAQRVEQLEAKIGK